MSIFLGKKNFNYSKSERVAYATITFLLLALINYTFIENVSGFTSKYLSVLLPLKEHKIYYGYFLSLMICSLGGLLSYHYPRIIHATLLIFPLLVIGS